MSFRSCEESAQIPEEVDPIIATKSPHIDRPGPVIAIQKPDAERAVTQFDDEELNPRRGSASCRRMRL